MRKNRGLAVLVVVGLALAGGATGILLPPEVEELRQHAVIMWQASVVQVPERNVVFIDAADINADGAPDMILAYDQGVKVLFGDGLGNFKTGSWALFEEEERVPLKYGYFVTPVEGFWCLGGCLADFDGDGDPDVAAIATNPRRGYAPKLYAFSTGRYGSLAQVWSSVLPFEASPLGAVDFTGDGQIDLVLMTKDKPARVVLLPGKKAFQFGEPIVIAEVHAKPVLLADFDASGSPDLAIFSGQEVTVLLGNGRGGFLPDPLGFTPSIGPIRRCRAGDLNGDGLLDLVVLTPNWIVVALQGPGRFLEVARFEPAIKAQDIHLSHMDGDGLLDLLVEGLYGERVAIYGGRGNGVFRGPASEFVLFGGGVIPSDVTGDGRCDLIQHVYVGVYIIYLTAIPPQREARLPIGGSRLITVVDWNGDGAEELVVQGARGIEVLWNAGFGAFVRRSLIPEFTRPGPGAQLVALDRTELEVTGERENLFVIRRRHPVAAALADGILWVLVLRDEVDKRYVLEERRVGELRGYTTAGQEVASLLVGEGVIPLLHSGDLDGDGTREVVVVKRREILVLWGGRDLRSYPWEIGNASLFQISDFSGDGRDEIVVVSASEAHIGLYLASFAQRELHLKGPVFQFPLGVIPLALVSAADMDEDGIADPVASAMTLFARLEAGKLQMKVGDMFAVVMFSRRGPAMVPIPEFPEGDAPWPFTGLAVGEFTGDGVADIAYTTVGAAGVFVLPGQGDGRFGGPDLFRASVGPLFSADLNKDGRLELLGSVVGMESAVWILWGGGER